MSLFPRDPAQAPTRPLNGSPGRGLRPAGNPVVLVHGYQDTAAVFQPLEGFLARSGFQIHPVTLRPSNGAAPLDALARQLADHLVRLFQPEVRFDLVGFSMGGVVGRYYLQRLGGVERVDRFVTLGAPHRGTWWAFGSRRPGVLQMRPGSPFLVDLERDLHLLERVNFTSLWTPFDLMIVPARSSVLPVGQEERLLLPYHKALVTSRRALARVAQLLAQPVQARDASAG